MPVGARIMADSKSHEYIVVARRYRPQGFDELVGQDMVSQALANAIQTDRVGHAYLFTGARGVGKTSTARIFSKALNCEQGPTPIPCNQCDICLSVAAGEDVDVLEIDGASNRGIDEIRQLRSNVNVRPSRSRFKVYIIDEVHMLTKEAFNALLKTLEEPPDHVKFIFCTTDPEKIPITVLSRCQRFDFSPVETQAIVERLQSIVASEGAEADRDALELLARRASGSMRDSQSLLEQLLSFTSERITAEAVHGMLGTAGAARLHGLVAAVVQRNGADALRELDEAVNGGVDAGQLAEQMLGCFRDMLALSVGGGRDLLLHTPDSEVESLSQLAHSWGTANLLAAAQILDQAIGRMRFVTHARILVETALIRIACLEDLQDLADAIQGLQAESEPTPGKKKSQVVAGEAKAVAQIPARSVEVKPAHSAESSDRGKESSVRRTVTEPEKAIVAGGVAKQKDTHSDQTETPLASRTDSAVGSAADLWKATIERLEGVAADYAAQFEAVQFSRGGANIANSAPNRLVVTFPAMYTSSKSFCQRPERHSEMERILGEVAGKKLKLEFTVREDTAHAAPPKPVVSARVRERQVAQHEFVSRASELFSASITSVSPAKPREQDA